MIIQPYITSVTDGQLDRMIDLGNITWSMTVNDSSLSTSPSREVGKDEVGDVDVPWVNVPGDTQAEKYRALEPDKKGIVLFAQTDADLLDGKFGTPFIWGSISGRSSDWDSTSISLDSVYSKLANRMVVREGSFTENRSKRGIKFSGMSMRGIAAEVGRICLAKPGGELPVDWQYLGEKHKTQSGQSKTVHERTYWAWNVANISGQQVFDKLAGVEDGVDMQFRPYLADNQHVRVRFVAGSDEERYLSQRGIPHHFTCFKGGGTLENIHVDYSRAYQRVYGTGAGSDAEVLTYKAEDLSGLTGTDPLSLNEMTLSDTDANKLALLKNQVNAKLKSWKRPLMQIRGSFDMNDANTPMVGEIWPGEVAMLDLRDYPDLPDGVYQMRIMEMSGDSSSTCNIVFDVMEVPYN